MSEKNIKRDQFGHLLNKSTFSFKKLVVFNLVVMIWALWTHVENNYLADPLYEISLRHIKIFRKEYNSKVLQIVMELVSLIGDKPGIFLWGILSLNLTNASNQMFFSSIICLFPLISQTMKSYLREPRPLFIDSEINVTKSNCKHMEFGNPSSHTFGVASLVPSLVFTIMKHYTIRNGYKFTMLRKVIINSLIFLLVIVIGFSRVYKGVHSYNQVLSGIVQGYLLSFVSIYCFYDTVIQFYVSIEKRSTFKLIFNKFTLAIGLAYGISTLIHLDTKKNFQVPQLWKDNVNKLCGGYSQTFRDPETANYEKIYVTLGVVGFYLGVIVDLKYFKLGGYPYWNETDFVTHMVRIIIFVIGLVPFVSPLLLKRDQWSYWTIIIFRTIGPAVMYSFYGIVLSKQLFLYFGLCNMSERYPDLTEHLRFIDDQDDVKTNQNGAKTSDLESPSSKMKSKNE